MSFFVAAIICTSAMVPGLISYGILSVEGRRIETVSVMLFCSVGILTCLTRSVTVGIAMLRPDFHAAVIWNRAFETALLLFLPAMPFFLSHIVAKPPPRILGWHRLLSYVGILLVIVFSYFIWFRPEMYRIPYPTGQLPHPAWLGRGKPGPINQLALVFLFVIVIYGLVYAIVARVLNRGRPHLTTLNVGFSLSILIILLEFYEIVFGRFPGPIPQYAFSRLLLGLTVLSLTTVIAMTQKAAIEAREVERDRKIIRKNRDELALVAYVDEMTGLPNRQALFRDLKTWFHDTGILVLIDVDNLAYVNSYYGYGSGDVLIRSMASICRATIPKGGRLYRVYGDIFAIYLTGPVQDAMELSSEILYRVKRLEIPEGEGTRFTASAGIAPSTVSANWEEWIGRANTALETAKLNRDRYVVFDPALHEDEKRRHSIITGLRESLDKKGFSLLYQPIVAKDGETLGAEALVRWEHPELGPVGPTEFIPLAESTGLVSRITEFVVHRTIEDFCYGESRGADWRVNVNLSGRDLMGGKLGGFMDQVISDYASCGDIMGFEVTETELLEDWEQTRLSLTGLKDRGFSVVLDDFGTGYSSLGYLSFLPLDKLKVDRSFIADIPEDDRKVILLDTIIDLGRGLHLDLVVEGVESRSQLEYLVDRNCRQFQGYYFAPPLSIEDFRKRPKNTG